MELKYLLQIQNMIGTQKKLEKVIITNSEVVRRDRIEINHNTTTTKLCNNQYFYIHHELYYLYNCDQM